ncbi:hypothetical protein [Citrobacter farmeri]|uniref:hypothetical protein n=1 Tax=Citrobacter farmeri TaxID=67824 RepID=UPI001900E3E2|nr:hypothetical protein [Citrobacter farmeri]MBJ9134397.1 hypothetical protein [Citrobacter farmeri]
MKELIKLVDVLKGHTETDLYDAVNTIQDLESAHVVFKSLVATAGILIGERREADEKALFEQRVSLLVGTGMTNEEARIILTPKISTITRPKKEMNARYKSYVFNIHESGKKRFSNDANFAYEQWLSDYGIKNPNLKEVRDKHKHDFIKEVLNNYKEQFIEEN